MTGLELYSVIIGTIEAVISILNFLSRFFNNAANNTAAQIQLSMEHHHQSKIRELIPSILEGREFSQSFIALLTEYTQAVAHWGAVRRLKNRIDKTLGRTFNPVLNDVRIYDYTIKALNGIFNDDPDIEVLMPPDYPPDQVPMDIPYRYNIKNVEKMNALGQKWKKILGQGPFHIDTAKRIAAWTRFIDQKRRHADAEAQAYESMLTQMGARRVHREIDWNSKLHYSNLSTPNLTTEFIDLTTLIPQINREVIHSYEMSDSLKGNDGKWVEQLACLWGEIKLAEATTRANVDSIAQRLVSEKGIEEGITEEILTEFSERVLILYGSFAEEKVLKSKARISEALRNRKLPETSDISFGLGFHTPVEYTVHQVVTEISTRVSTKYYEWLGQTVQSLQTTVDHILQSNDSRNSP